MEMPECWKPAAELMRQKLFDLLDVEPAPSEIAAALDVFFETLKEQGLAYEDEDFIDVDVYPCLTVRLVPIPSQTTPSE
jgi:hypothetical protein